ncbi:MAG: glycosidase [Candidatus Njordarchaeales archaeon]
MQKTVERIISLRRNETKDIIRRIGIVTGDRLQLLNFPINRPTVAFNASILLNGDLVEVFARIILGYYTYASAIVSFVIPLEEISDISKSVFNARIIISPDNKYDIWGTEDPRATQIGNRKVLTYTGRTVNYFDPSIRVERTLPIIAVKNKGDSWKKLAVVRLREMKIVSDKDAFLVDIDGRLVLFHRPHTYDHTEEFLCTVTEVSETIIQGEKIKEFLVNGTKVVLKAAPFEEKIGWGTPPIKVGKEYLLFLHGVDQETKEYKVFAVLINRNLEIVAVTPYYVMKPKEPYEKYGDRPLVVFPCGAVKIDDKVLISYGAADIAIGFGEIDLSEIMSILDKNRIIE